MDDRKCPVHRIEVEKRAQEAGEIRVVRKPRHDGNDKAARD